MIFLIYQIKKNRSTTIINFRYHALKIPPLNIFKPKIITSTSHSTNSFKIHVLTHSTSLMSRTLNNMRVLVSWHLATITAPSSTTNSALLHQTKGFHGPNQALPSAGSSWNHSEFVVTKCFNARYQILRRSRTSERFVVRYLLRKVYVRFILSRMILNAARCPPFVGRVRHAILEDRFEYFVEKFWGFVGCFEMFVSEFDRAVY